MKAALLALAALFVGVSADCSNTRGLQEKLDNAVISLNYYKSNGFTGYHLESAQQGVLDAEIAIRECKQRNWVLPKPGNNVEMTCKGAEITLEIAEKVNGLYTRFGTNPEKMRKAQIAIDKAKTLKTKLCPKSI